MLWGLAAFLCIDLAPAFGLPPQPPGVPVADIYARQLWWLAAVITAAVGLWLLSDRSKSLPVRLLGLLVAILPHAFGAPVAQGVSSVPASLIREFAVVSILTTGIFWISLGTFGGLLFQRFGHADEQ
jgi:cobalt transporter subunit CbtA